MKKVLSCFLCVILLTNLYVVVFAANNNPKIVIDTITASSGDTVSVALTLQNNPGISYIRVTPEYAEGLTLTDVQNGSVLKDMDNALNIVWSADSNSQTDGILATLTFKVADDAVEGDYDIGLKIRECYNSEYEDVLLTAVNGKIVVRCQSETESLIQISSISASPGELLNVPITIQNNPGIAYLRVTLEYAEGLTLTEVENGNILTDMDNARNIVWSADFDSQTDGILATLTFKVADDAVEGDYDIGLKIKECYNSEYEDVSLAATNGKISIIKSYSVMPKGDVIIDNNLKIIYGFSVPISDIKDCFECVNCEISHIQGQNGLGTDSKINIIFNGNIVDVYTVLIFGDVNGDSVCNGMDAVVVNCISNGMLSKEQIGSVAFMSADCNHDNSIDDSDVELLCQAGLFLEAIKQTINN